MRTATRIPENRSGKGRAASRNPLASKCGPGPGTVSASSMAATDFSFYLTSDPLDAGALVASAPSPADGAVVSFSGVVREHARGRRVIKIEYEAYGSMANLEMERIFETMRSRFEITHATVVHRTGLCRVGEVSIVIIVAAPHRAPAFDACRYCIDTLKQTVPIWKHEFYDSGDVWVGDRS